MGTLDSTNTDTTNSSVDIDFSEEQLRLAAQALDEGNDTVEINAEPSDGGSDTNEGVEGEQSPDSQSTDNALHDAEQNEGEASSLDENKPKEDSKPDSAQTEPKESNYSKAKKNAERFDRNWKRLQEQQAELAKQRAELAAREAALQQRANRQAPAQSTQHQQPTEAQQGFTPERYEEAADEWEREGEFKMAELARAQAKLLKDKPAQVPTQTQVAPPTAVATTPPQEWKTDSVGPGSPAFISAWNENLRSLEQDADFADLKNRESALYKATAAVLQEEQRLSYFPDGIRQAARIAKLRVEAGAVPELQSKVQAYEQELAKLRAATSPSRGAPNSRGQAKAFEELSLAEQEQELMRLAREVDEA